jgi:NlpC/P60 family
MTLMPNYSLSRPMMRHSFLALGTVLCSLAGTTRVLAQEVPELPKPFAELSRTILAGRDSLVNVTRQQVGLRYQYGAKRPGIAFDCSALVQWVAGLFGRDLPRTAAEQSKVGVEVPKDSAQLVAGDLLFFGKGKRVTHIGIYVGDGRFVHAASRRKGVIETDLARVVKKRYWKGARRIWIDADSAFAPPNTAEFP